MVTDARLTELVKQFGRDHAQAVWDAGLAAIATIDEVIREHAIDLSFEWVDGYLHAPLKDYALLLSRSRLGATDVDRTGSATPRHQEEEWLNHGINQTRRRGATA
jgi:hypothetical protein